VLLIKAAPKGGRRARGDVGREGPSGGSNGDGQRREIVPMGVVRREASSKEGGGAPNGTREGKDSPSSK
jgi:hypothetical protein